MAPLKESFSIPVIVGSTRRDRQTPKVARFIHRLLGRRDGVTSDELDLLAYDFPIMEERLRFRDDPPSGLDEFSERIDQADSLVIVTPEYNGGYPGVLKNALDYLLPEYKRKPFGIVTVSAGPWGGVRCLGQLRLVVLAMGGLPIPAQLAVPHAGKSFDADGQPEDPAWEKRTQRFVDELLWYTEALAVQRARDGGDEAA